MDASGRVKLSDFGIMRDFLSDEASLSHTFTGTLAYMAPERLGAGAAPCGGNGAGEAGASVGGHGEGTGGEDGSRSDEGYSYPADVWGLGLSLLALALGQPPLAGRVRSVWDVLAAQVLFRYPTRSQGIVRPRMLARPRTLSQAFASFLFLLLLLLLF